MHVAYGVLWNGIWLGSSKIFFTFSKWICIIKHIGYWQHEMNLSQYVFNNTTVIPNASVNPWSGEKRWGGLKIKQKINTRLMDGFSCSFGLLSTHKATWKSRKVQKGKINITLKCEWINWHHFQPISTVMKFFWHTVKVWCLNALYHFNNL